MDKLTTDERKFSELGFGDKLKYGLATFFALSSVTIGFISFAILLEIPGSVIGISGLWISACLGILGISQYFKSQLVEFQTKVDEHLKKIDGKQIDSN